MDDTLLASRAMAGDLDSFGQLYDRYFPRIYDFAWRILKDGDEAASLTESIFATSMTSMAALPNAASFRSWLFTIAYTAAVGRSAGLGRVAGRPEAVHEEAFGSFGVPDASYVDDPSVAGGDAETAALVWEAATALSPRDYAVLDLHVRQGLDSAEIAAVLAMGKSNAATLIGRMTSAASDVMTGYIVARTGNKDCEGLRQTLAPFDIPPYTDEVRRVVDLHVRGCEACRATRKGVPAPLVILGAFAAVRPPMSLKGDVWRSIAASWHVPRAQASMATASGVDLVMPGAGTWAPGVLPPGDGIGLGGGGSFGGGGFGATSGPGWDRKRVLWFAGAVAGMFLFAFAVGTVLVMAVGGGGGSGTPAAVTSETPTDTVTATEVASLTPGVSVITSTPAPDTATPPPTATVPAPPTATEPAPPTATNTPAKAKSVTPTPIVGTPPPGVRTATPTAKAIATGTATP
jgi:DNA-directed RNA polymerase specialized sigma24 family protein